MLVGAGGSDGLLVVTVGDGGVIGAFGAGDGPAGGGEVRPSITGEAAGGGIFLGTGSGSIGSVVRPDVAVAVSARGGDTGAGAEVASAAVTGAGFATAVAAAGGA